MAFPCPLAVRTTCDCYHGNGCMDSRLPPWKLARIPPCLNDIYFYTILLFYAPYVTHRARHRSVGAASVGRRGERARSADNFRQVYRRLNLNDMFNLLRAWCNICKRSLQSPSHFRVHRPLEEYETRRGAASPDDKALRQLFNQHRRVNTPSSRLLLELHCSCTCTCPCTCTCNWKCGCGCLNAMQFSYSAMLASVCKQS